MGILEEVKKAYKKRVLFTIHALTQMNAPDRMISRREVRQVIEKGQLVEDYPDDPRGHSCLIGTVTEAKRWVHVLCSSKDEYLAVVTAYLPDEREWEQDMKIRRKQR